MSTIDTGFENAMKNFMLDEWRGQGTINLSAGDGPIFVAGTTITFNAASEGSISVSGTPTITIPDDDTYQVTNLRIRIGQTEQIIWTIPSGDQPTFTNGGTITIDGLSVSID